jgi:hypothetical protein
MSTVKMSAALVCAVAGLAMGQITVTQSAGLARATAGDGSGQNQQTSASVTGFTLGATKNFQNGGHVDADNAWGFANWLMSGSFSSQSFAASQNEAGWAETSTVVRISVTQDMDVEYNGGYSVNSPSGSVEVSLRNVVTNGYVAGGQSPNLVHINPGTYELRAESYLPYGDLSGGFNYQFRPGNDRCVNARVIGTGVHYGTTNFATNDGQATCGSSNLSPSVWYKWVAPRAGDITISTCGSSFDTVLSVYDTNSCPSTTGTQIACNDDAPLGSECGGRASSVTFTAIANETYYIRLSGYNDARGDFRLNVGPANNECETARVVGEGAYPFSNVFATTDGPVLNSCVFAGDTQVNNDLWYVFTPTEAGFLDVTTCGSGFDTKLAMYINAPCDGRSTYVTCNDDSCGFQSAMNLVPVTAGWNYYIRVGGYVQNRGTGTLNINFTPSCPADYNNDGGVDGDDVIAFFADWDAGVIGADFNGDGGVDGDDVIGFFGNWDAGC